MLGVRLLLLRNRFGEARRRIGFERVSGSCIGEGGVFDIRVCVLSVYGTCGVFDRGGRRVGFLLSDGSNGVCSVCSI